LPQGYAFGYAIGLSLRTLHAEAAILALSAPLATIFSVGLLYSLGAGVTAHVSEFDFFLTADVRPREYLTADLAFQFVRLLPAAGIADVFTAGAVTLCAILSR